MKTIAIASLLLAGCADLYSGADDGAGACPSPRPGCASDEDCAAGACPDQRLYACDAGQWTDVGTICEGVDNVPIAGDWLLEQTIWGPTCIDLAPRRAFTLTVDEAGAVSALAPVVVVSGEADSGWDLGTMFATVDDDWGGATTRIDYELTVSPSGRIEGVGLTDACADDVQVLGARCPAGAQPCGVYDQGWHTVWCTLDVVYADDRSVHAFCAPGTDDEVCEVGGVGNSVVVATCPAGCANPEWQLFETDAAYDAFDPASLCRL